MGLSWQGWSSSEPLLRICERGEGGHCRMTQSLDELFWQGLTLMYSGLPRHSWMKWNGLEFCDDLCLNYSEVSFSGSLIFKSLLFLCFIQGLLPSFLPSFKVRGPCRCCFIFPQKKKNSKIEETSMFSVSTKIPGKAHVPSAVHCGVRWRTSTPKVFWKYVVRSVEALARWFQRLLRISPFLSPLEVKQHLLLRWKKSFFPHR